MLSRRCGWRAERPWIKYVARALLPVLLAAFVKPETSFAPPAVADRSVRPTPTVQLSLHSKSRCTSPVVERSARNRFASDNCPHHQDVNSSLHQVSLASQLEDWPACIRLHP